MLGRIKLSPLLVYTYHTSNYRLAAQVHQNTD